MYKSEIESFRTETLIAHNQYRAQHSTTPLSLSFQLSDGAQHWAETLAKNDQFERSPKDESYNENIACTWGSQLTGTLVSRMWYEEGKDYDYTRDTLSKFTQNFTQILWKASREMGVGRARTKHGKEIIVARYHPPGNTGDFTANVLRKSEFRETSIPVIDSLALNRIPGLRQFQEDCLVAHNKYRQRHRAPPLQWSYKLAYEAQRWAQHLLDSEQFIHSENIAYGENLAGRKGYDLNGKKAAKLWYDESKLFNFEDPSFSPDTGNFTQLIWRGSRYFGIGKAFNNDMCIVVAYYFPPGNVVEEFNDNVGIIEDSIDGVIAETTKPAGIMAEYGQYELEKFRTEFLVFTNYLRARHASPPLTMSHLLMNNAQNWANQLLRSGKITYSNDEHVGESIAYAEREDLTAFKVSHRWYGEIQSHDFSSSNPNAETLNFTQLVWHDSRELGVGKAVGKDGFSVVVAQYSPPGNIDGIVKENVGKLCSPDMKEIASIKKRRYDENKNVVEDKKKKNSFGGILSPSRTEETYVFRPPSGEFNQLVWIDHSSTPLESAKQPEVNGDVVMKENALEHEYESPPPSPSRAVDQIEKLLTNTRQTWETESSGEEEIDEGTEPRKPDVDEYVVLSKSTSREDIGSEEGSVYKRLSRTFSEEMEFTRQEMVREEEETPHRPPESEKTRVESTPEDIKKEELKNDPGVQSPIVLRKSQQYLHHYDKEFGQVKEASIVTRPGVSDRKDTEDWQMIEDILESPRPLMLSQSTNDETILSPENDGQRAVIRRIDDENTTTSDAVLPVLEHLVTPTFARTVDHGVVDEEFNSLFSEDTLENEPDNQELEKEIPQVISTPTLEDRHYEEDEQLYSDKEDQVDSNVLEPIEHNSISREVREYSYAVSEDVFHLIGEFPPNDESLHETSIPTQAFQEEPVDEEDQRAQESQWQNFDQTKVSEEGALEEEKEDFPEESIPENTEEKRGHYEHFEEGESVKKEEVLLEERVPQESIIEEESVLRIEETEGQLEEALVDDSPDEMLDQHEHFERPQKDDESVKKEEVLVEEHPEDEPVEKKEALVDESMFQEESVLSEEKTDNYVEEQSVEDIAEETLEHDEDFEDPEEAKKEVSTEEHILQEEPYSIQDETKYFEKEDQPVNDFPEDELERDEVSEPPEDQPVEKKEVLMQESTFQEEHVINEKQTKDFEEEQTVEDFPEEKLEQDEFSEPPADQPVEKEEVLMQESSFQEEHVINEKQTKDFEEDQPVEDFPEDKLEQDKFSEPPEDQPLEKEEVMVEELEQDLIEEQSVEDIAEETLEQDEVSEDPEEAKKEVSTDEHILQEEPDSSQEKTKEFEKEEQDFPEEKLEKDEVSELPEDEPIDEEEVLVEEPTFQEEPVEDFPEETFEQDEVSEQLEDQPAEEEVFVEESTFQEESVLSEEEIKDFEEEQTVEDFPEKRSEQDEVRDLPDEPVEEEEVLVEESTFQDESVLIEEERKDFEEDQPVEDVPEEKLEQGEVSELPEDQPAKEEEVLVEESTFQDESVLIEEERKDFEEDQPVEDVPEEKLEQGEVSELPEDQPAKEEEVLVEESTFQDESVLIDEGKDFEEEGKDFEEDQPVEDVPEEKLEQDEVSEPPEDRHVEKEEVLMQESTFQEEHVISEKQTKEFEKEKLVEDFPEDKLEQDEFSEHPEDQPVEKEEEVVEELEQNLVDEQSVEDIAEETLEQDEVSQYPEEAKKEVSTDENILQEEPDSTQEETIYFEKEEQAVEEFPEDKLEQDEVSEQLEDQPVEEEVFVEEPTFQEESVIGEEKIKDFEEEQTVEDFPEKKSEQDEVVDLPEDQPVEKEEVLVEESTFQDKSFHNEEETKDFEDDQPVEDYPEEKLEKDEVSELPEDEPIDKEEVFVQESTFQEESVISEEETKNLEEEQIVEDFPEIRSEQDDVGGLPEDQPVEKEEVFAEESTFQDEPFHSEEETKEDQPVEDYPEEKLEQDEASQQPEDQPALREDETKDFEVEDFSEEKLEQDEVRELPEDETVEEGVLVEESTFQEEPVISEDETKDFEEEQTVDDVPEEKLEQDEVPEHPKDEFVEKEVLVEESTFHEQAVEDFPEVKLEKDEVSELPDDQPVEKEEVLLEESTFQDEYFLNEEETKDFEEDQPLEEYPEEKLEQDEVSQQPEDQPVISEDETKDFEVEDFSEEKPEQDEVSQQPEDQPVLSEDETKDFEVEDFSEEKLEQDEVSQQPEDQPALSEDETKDFEVEDFSEEKLEQDEVRELPEDETVEEGVLVEESTFQEEPVISEDETKDFEEGQTVDDVPEEKLEQDEVPEHPKDEFVEEEVLVEESTFQEQAVEDFPEDKLEKDEVSEIPDDQPVEKEEVLLEESTFQDEYFHSEEETKDFEEDQPVEAYPEEKLEQDEVSQQPEDQPVLSEDETKDFEVEVFSEEKVEQDEVRELPEDENVEDEVLVDESTFQVESVISEDETKNFEEKQTVEEFPEETLEQDEVFEQPEDQPVEEEELLMEESTFHEKPVLSEENTKDFEEEEAVEEFPEKMPEQDEVPEQPEEQPVEKEELLVEGSTLKDAVLTEEETIEIEDEQPVEYYPEKKLEEDEVSELPENEPVEKEGTKEEMEETKAAVEEHLVEEYDESVEKEEEYPEKLSLKEQSEEDIAAEGELEEGEKSSRFVDDLETEEEQSFAEECEHSSKHVRFSAACEVFEEESRPVVDTVLLEETTTVHKDDQEIYKENSEENPNQEEFQADGDDVDINARWVEVEKNPVVWHTVKVTQEEPEQSGRDKECDPAVVEEEVERNTTMENENVPDQVIHIGAHAIVKDVLKQALAQTEEQGDVSFTPRLVQTESGNMVMVKMEETGSLEERYELMEFELYEQYMKEKGTFSPFQLEFPCDVDKVFSSTEADKPLETLEELEYMGDEEDDVDYGAERPLLASHLSIIMEEPSSGTDSLSGSLVKVQTNENVQTDTGDSKQYVINSPSEFEIIQGTVREVQNKRQKTETDCSDNVDDDPATTTDEFILLWREKQPNVDEKADADEIAEQEMNEETSPEEVRAAVEKETTKEKQSANDSEMDYLKLDLRESPDVPSESSVSPGSSVRSWISSDLSSLDDETTGKHHKNREDPDISSEQKENLGLELMGSEMSHEEHEIYQDIEQTHQDSKVIDDPSECEATETNIEYIREGITPLELECPSDSSTKHVSVSTEQDGDRQVTRVVTTETRRKVVKIIDGKEVPVEGEEWEQFESKFGDLLEKEGGLEAPAVTTEEHDDGGITKTITTVVTRHQEPRPIITSVDTNIAELESNGFQAESGVPVEDRESCEMKTTITRTITQNVEMEPTQNLAECLEKHYMGSLDSSQGMIIKDVETEPESVQETIHETESPDKEDEVITEEQEEDGTRTTITRVVTTRVERAPDSLTMQGDVVKILEEFQDHALRQPEITTEEHEKDGVKTTITRVVTRKEITEPELISDEQCIETLEPFEIGTEQFDPVVTDITEEDDGAVKRTVTRTVTRTVKTEPIITSEDQGDSIKSILEELKKQERNDTEYPQIESEGDDERMAETGGTQYNTGLSEHLTQEKFGDFPNERDISYEVTKEDDGTVTTMTRIETTGPMVLEEHPDVLKEVLERTDEHSLETAPSVEYVDHGDGHVVREVRREVREVTTMESTSALVLLGDFQARVLLEHNKCRYIHYSKPLIWSDSLAKEAQKWAEHLAESGCLIHSTSSEYGENVAYSSEVLNGYDLSQLWYDEIKHYSFVKPGFTTQTGHFTQMVWEGTKEMGVGMAIAPDGTSYYVARYNPPGNKLGCFEENVLSPRENAVEGRPRRKKSSSPPSPPSEIETIKHDCLVTHNYHRFQHGVSELSWSPMLAVEALHSAERVIRTGSIHSSDTSNSGENIAMSSDRSFDVKAAIELWYKEERDYDYTSPAFSSLTRNFSQMLWRECKEVGMALARSDSGDLVVVVAKYYPPGNVVGMFQDNVLPTSQGSEDL